MTWFHLLFLAIIQGITEFLPISSSAHLILPAQIFNWPDQGPLIDLMAHLGTLGAVVLYYRKDVAHMIGGGFDLISFRENRRQSARAGLALCIIFATPPALIVGLLMSMKGWDEAVRSPLIIAWAMIGFGIVLWLADIWGKKTYMIKDMNWRVALMIGCAQVLAFIPGTSRSGITMTAARALGYTRPESARFSMLMAIPIILAGGSFAFLKLLTDGDVQARWQDGVVVAGLSLVTAYFAIVIFMRLIDRISFFPFMLYRLALGGALLWWLSSSFAT
ncbi:MAG TPA: undecaprenyl-diphosphate phosphatase [Hellea balneolensis]|uniref:Undecaprenyl-diphosphatase n=1 Tax=Hellea balneolensis TaxID=287478 RepID=A0A7C3C3V8_9PROT|nr:undecaprenyl-diphosphate phosphatase [Hellea balneolensis]